MARPGTLALASLLLAVGPAAADFPVKFSPPPNPMLNMTSTDATKMTTVDYLNMSSDVFSLHSFNFGMGRIEKGWETGGWAMGLGVPFIVGSVNTGGGFGGPGSSSNLTMFGMGESFMLNLFLDPLSRDMDDNSLPVYLGGHFNFFTLFGSQTDFSMSTFVVTFGIQFGIQAGLNLNETIKFIPYVDFNYDMGGSALTSITVRTPYGTFAGSTSTSLGSQPLAVAPGFDILLRPYGLSLGGAYQVSKSVEGGDQKTINLHLRFVKRFRSICGG
jgi:hypothetical protein